MVVFKSSFNVDKIQIKVSQHIVRGNLIQKLILADLAKCCLKNVLQRWSVLSALHRTPVAQHVWVLSTAIMASVTEALHFLFYLIELNFRSHMLGSGSCTGWLTFILYIYVSKWLNFYIFCIYHSFQVSLKGGFRTGVYFFWLLK